MTSLKLAQSNRVNALKSTGPRSDPGKAAVSRNALKSGIYAKAEIIQGEDPADLQDLIDEYVGHYSPADPQERFQLDIMIRAEWQSRRLARVEAELYVFRSHSLSRAPEDCPLGHIYYGADTVFARLQRQITATHRTYIEASRELAALQSARAGADVVAPAILLAGGTPPIVSAPTAQPVASQPTYPEIGFVSQSPVEAPDVAPEAPLDTSTVDQSAPL